MLAQAKNLDNICFQLRNNLYSEIDHPLKKELDAICQDIKATLLSAKTLKVLPTPIIKSLFNLRFKALLWLSKENNMDYLQMVEDVMQKLDEKQDHQELATLVENLRFSLRCCEIVVDSLTTNEASGNFQEAFEKMPEITFDMYFAILSMSYPDDKTVQDLFDWTNASLNIEFGLLAVDIIKSENLKLSRKAIFDLEFLVANSAQEYYALAVGLGIVKLSNEYPSSPEIKYDKSFIKEQQALAELGLSEWSKNIGRA